MITWDVPMITDLSDDQHEMNRCLVWGTLVGVRSSNWGPIHGIQRSVHGAKRWTHARMSRSTGPRRQEVAAFQRVQWRQRERESAVGCCGAGDRSLGGPCVWEKPKHETLSQFPWGCLGGVLLRGWRNPRREFQTMDISLQVLRSSFDWIWSCKASTQ